MKAMFCTAGAMLAALFLAAAVLADDDDYPSWRPNNTTANTITGPIIVLPDRLHVANANFPLRKDIAIPAFKPDQGPIPARIYAVTSPANPVLLNGNKLCGEQAPTWIVVVPKPPTGLEVDAFTGADKPANSSSPGLCNSFAYIR